MIITKTQLRKIVKEEIENIQKEGIFDFFKKKKSPEETADIAAEKERIRAEEETVWAAEDAERKRQLAKSREELDALSSLGSAGAEDRRLERAAARAAEEKRRAYNATPASVRDARAERAAKEAREDRRASRKKSGFDAWQEDDAAYDYMTRM